MLEITLNVLLGSSCSLSICCWLSVGFFSPLNRFHVLVRPFKQCEMNVRFPFVLLFTPMTLSFIWYAWGFWWTKKSDVMLCCFNVCVDLWWVFLSSYQLPCAARIQCVLAQCWPTVRSVRVCACMSVSWAFSEHVFLSSPLKMCMM